MIRQFLLATAIVAIVASPPAEAAASKARASAGASAALPASNPFAAPSALPFQSPDFSKIKSSDYLPALLAGIAEEKAEIARIANNPAPPNFANTVIAMERAGQLFERVNLAFQAVKGANSDEVLEATDTKASPLWAPDYLRPDYIFLNQKLFQRFKRLHEHEAELNLNPEQARLLDVYYGQFVHAGAELPATKQVQLKALNKRITGLETAFTQKLRAAAKAGAVHFDDASALAGLSPEQLAAAQEAAKGRNLSGYVLPLQNTTQQPALASQPRHAPETVRGEP